MESGICVSKGYAIGKAFVYKDIDIQAFAHKTAHPEEEVVRLTIAVEETKKQIKETAKNAVSNVGCSESVIFESHISFLNDPEFIGKVYKEILNYNKTSEKAICDVTNELSAVFLQFEDEYMRERAADIRDVGARVLDTLTGTGRGSLEDVPENTIIIAHDLMPSDTARIDKRKVLGFITETGGKTSHTAIMARAMNLTAIVGFQDITSKVKTGDVIIVDGISGEVFINPDDTAIEFYEDKKTQYIRHLEKLKEKQNESIISKNGKQILVAANIGSIAEAESAVCNGADAIGLFRTEFIYMDRNSLPDEEEQFEIYKAIAQKMGKKPITVRTIDIGGDKSLPYLNIPEEMNPFLGLRAIRLCLKHRDIFKTQLRAILRASFYGNMQIMFPMIGNMDELNRAKAAVRECKEELDAEGVKYNDRMKIGMMIEIPAAAIMADEFAKCVDFFSIGTNDLTQYTLAVDRLNENISELYDPQNPAVMRLIKGIIHAAHANEIPCFMCGEMAGDSSAIPLLLNYGLDEFSVSPVLIPEIKSLIRKYQ